MKNSRIAQVFRRVSKAYFAQILPLAWRRETSIPGVDHHDRWTPQNPALGQSAVTALLIQDRHGGEILVAEIPGEGRHFWNRLADGHEMDFTRRQYPRGTKVPKGTPIGRDDLLGSDRAAQTFLKARYEYFCDRFDDVERMLEKYCASLVPAAPEDGETPT